MIWLPRWRAGGMWICKPGHLSLIFFLIFLFFSLFLWIFTFFLGDIWIQGNPFSLFVGPILNGDMSIKGRHFSLNFYETWLFLYYKVVFKTNSYNYHFLTFENLFYIICRDWLACRFYPFFFCLFASLYGKLGQLLICLIFMSSSNSDSFFLKRKQIYGHMVNLWKKPSSLNNFFFFWNYDG